MFMFKYLHKQCVDRHLKVLLLPLTFRNHGETSASTIIKTIQTNKQTKNPEEVKVASCCMYPWIGHDFNWFLSLHGRSFEQTSTASRDPKGSHHLTMLLQVQRSVSVFSSGVTATVRSTWMCRRTYRCSLYHNVKKLLCFPVWLWHTGTKG